MKRFDRKETQPLAFDETIFTKYMNQIRSPNDSLEDFIELSPQQKNIIFQLAHPTERGKIIMPLISAEETAHYYSQEANSTLREEHDAYEAQAKYMIDNTITIPFPLGISLNGIEPIISYKEAYKPIIFDNKCIGAVYEIALENQFPTIVSTETMFANNERIRKYANHIKKRVEKEIDKGDPDFPEIDLYGARYNETTSIRTVPKIRMLNRFILDNYFAESYKKLTLKEHAYTF